MTVRDLVGVTHGMNDVDVYVGDNMISVVSEERLNSFALDLVGDFLVDQFFTPEHEKMIVEVKIIPLKANNVSA